MGAVSWAWPDAPFPIPAHRRARRTRIGADHRIGFSERLANLITEAKLVGWPGPFSSETEGNTLRCPQRARANTK